MECDQVSSSTWFTPNSSQPDFTSNFSLGGRAILGWWGGTPNFAGVANATQEWRLLLGRFNDEDAGSVGPQNDSNMITSAGTLLSQPLI